MKLIFPNQMSFSDVETELRKHRDTFFKLLADKIAKHPTYSTIEGLAAEIEEQAALPVKLKKKIAPGDFFCVAKHWDFTLELEPEPGMGLEIKSLGFLYAPMGILKSTLGDNPLLRVKYTESGLDSYVVSNDFNGFEENDYLVQHMEDWQAGEAPPVDVYSFVVRSLGT